MPTALSTPDKYQQSPSSRPASFKARRQGPHVVTAADLHPVHERNRIFIFADDTHYLVVLGVSTDTCQEEIDHIQTWAADNNVKLNRNKTKRREGVLALPPPRPDIEHSGYRGGVAA